MDAMPGRLLRSGRAKPAGNSYLRSISSVVVAMSGKYPRWCHRSIDDHEIVWETTGTHERVRDERAADRAPSPRAWPRGLFGLAGLHDVRRGVVHGRDGAQAARLEVLERGDQF